MKQAIYIVTGVMASGKSTVSGLLASSQRRAVHLRGDVFRKMIISGREEMCEQPSDEAVRQLKMRYQIAAGAAKAYYDHGFTVILQDNYYGPMLPHMKALLEGYPAEIVVLCPSIEAVEAREAGRGKVGYGGFTVRSLYDGFLRDTPRIGFWLDTTGQTPEQSAAAIIAHFEAASM